MQPIFEFIRAWQALGKSDTLNLSFDKFKDHYFPMLAFCIEDMNWKFGAGEVSAIIFNINECRPDEEFLYGQVVRIVSRREDGRFFKFENGHVVYLSHKRKLKNGTIQHA